MDKYKLLKIEEQILIQSRLNKTDARNMSAEIYVDVDWSNEYNYREIVYNRLSKLNLLRTQVQKDCKIRDKISLK